MKKIVICGGHLTPALALIEGLEGKKDTRIFFFGREFSTEGSRSPSAELRVISDKKIGNARRQIKFIKITAGRLQRKFTGHTIPSLIKIPIGFLQSFCQLLLIRPDIVVSFGGYLSTPVIFGAWLLGIDSITHEQAAVPGLANRINSLFVKRIFLTWSQTQKYFPAKKTEIIGNLTRKSINNKSIQNKMLKEFIAKRTNIILVTGGNQGSHFLNVLTRALVPELKEFSVIHQIGTANLEDDLAKSKKIKSLNYFPIDYIDPKDIGTVFTKAQLLIARSGANTVWEIAVLGKVAILIPLPISASQEQTENARILQKAGFAKLIKQSEATSENIESQIHEIFKNLNLYKKKAQNFSKTLQLDAVSRIIRYVYST